MKMHLKSALLAVSLLGLSAGVAAAFPASVRITTEIYWGPGPEYPVADEIAAGTEVDVRRCSNDWCQIQLDDEIAFIPRWALAFAGRSIPFIGVFPGYEVYGSYVYGPSFAYRAFGNRHSRRESRDDRHSRNDSRAVRHSREDSSIIDQRRQQQLQKFQQQRIQTKDTKQPLIQKQGVEPRIQTKETKKDTKQPLIQKQGVEPRIQTKETKKDTKQPLIQQQGVEPRIQTKETKKETKQPVIQQQGGQQQRIQTKDTKQPVIQQPVKQLPPAKEKSKEKEKSKDKAGEVK
jgi:hypothetical protein